MHCPMGEFENKTNGNHVLIIDWPRINILKPSESDGDLADDIFVSTNISNLIYILPCLLTRIWFSQSRH